MKKRNWQYRGRVMRARRLGIESLESRNLLAVMRIVDWNTMNGPNDAAGDANFSTILQAIGDETIQGNTQPISILALQETNPAGQGGDSISHIDSILESLYPLANYEFYVTPVDGGGDSTGFVYDTTSVSLLEAVQVGAGTLTHNVSRGKFRPDGTTGESDFYVYSIHLKSGTNGSDATLRGSEAALLRSDADALGEGANVLFVGDFNLQGSSEVAFTTFVSAGAAQLQDVADAPGAWNNNPSFKSLHTQDPQTALDDRFDIQFASGEFFDGTGLEYVGNSYHVFGNNGTHTFDMPITTGTGASANVLNALLAASDHLPVVADYQIITSTPNVRITQTLGGAKVIEGGLYDTYHIVLDTVPASDVTITVTPDAQLDVGNGAGIAKVFTFTHANALTPQTVVVRAVDDALGEGNHTGLITHGSASSDVSYSGLTVTSVIVSIVDNDAPTIAINELDSDQNATDTGEFIELYDGGVGNSSLTGYIVVFYNGNDPNNASYFAIDLAGVQTDANGFFVLGNAAVTPTQGLIFNNNTLQNGADAVALYFGSPVSAFPNGTPPTTTNLRDAVVYDTSDADDVDLIALLTPGQPQINENENGAGITESISRVPDGGTPLQTTTYVTQSPTPWAFNTTYPFGVEILQSDSRVDVAEGGATDSYQIALESIPTANVEITVHPDSQTDLGAGAGMAIVLTFTPANALIPQTINVAAFDDSLIEGAHTSTITHVVSSADSQYNGLAIGNLIANIVDNDSAAPASIVISELMYNPASDETSPGVGEWIEVVNTGTTVVDLAGWQFDDEDATNWGAIPAGTVLQPNQIAVFVDGDFTTAAEFRTEWNVPSNSLVVGISWGSLANTPSSTNEKLALLNNVGEQMDFVNYDDASPWPTGIEGLSIHLKNLALDNNDGANWAGSVAGSGGAHSPTGTVFSTADVGSPGRLSQPGDYNADDAVDAADYVVWRKTLGSTTNLRADGSGLTTGIPNGVVDQFDYDYWRANFGAAGGAAAGFSIGTSSGAMAVAANTSDEAVATPITTSTIEMAEEPTSTRVVPTIDQIPVDVSNLLQPRHEAVGDVALSAVDSSNLLLAMLRNDSCNRSSETPFESYSGTTDELCLAADSFFASLGDDDLAACEL